MTPGQGKPAEDEEEMTGNPLGFLAEPYNCALDNFQLNSSTFERHFKWGQGLNGSS